MYPEADIAQVGKPSKTKELLETKSFSGSALSQARTVPADIPARNIRHSSRLSFRRPQCFTFDGLYSGIGTAPCSASIMPTWACSRGCVRVVPLRFRGSRLDN